MTNGAVTEATETAKKKRAPRANSKAAKTAAVVAAHADLLATLDELAALPPEACACGATTSHERCGKCGVCKPRHGGSTYLGGFGNQACHAAACGECGAKANRYSTPLYTWFPKDRFATTFARDLAGKIRRGLMPSPKQVELANKLAREDHTRKPQVWERPAISWVNPKWTKAWRALSTLVARDSFALTIDTERLLEWSSRETATSQEKVSLREITNLVRATVARIIDERTGYAVLLTVDHYADALKACGDDKMLAAVLHELLDVHTWLLREKRVIDTCPPHLTELRDAIATGDKDAALVLADAIAAGHTEAA